MTYGGPRSPIKFPLRLGRHPGNYLVRIQLPLELTVDHWQRKLPEFTSQQAFPKFTCPSNSEVRAGDLDGDEAPAILEISLVGRQTWKQWDWCDQHCGRILERLGLETNPKEGRPLRQ